MLTIITKVRSWFTRQKSDDVKTFKTPGRYTDLHGLSKWIQGAITALEKDRATLYEALAESRNSGRVRFKGKFHNRLIEFHGPREVEARIAYNETLIELFRTTLNNCQNEPHADFALLQEQITRALRKAA